jgi:hypothetical protein
MTTGLASRAQHAVVFRGYFRSGAQSCQFLILQRAAENKTTCVLLTSGQEIRFVGKPSDPVRSSKVTEVVLSRRAFK